MMFCHLRALRTWGESTSPWLANSWGLQTIVYEFVFDRQTTIPESILPATSFYQISAVLDTIPLS
jgi:hypothetical protein